MAKILNFLNKNSVKLLLTAIVLYFAVFSLICFFKYSQFGYNGLDLAIYNQVFFNSAMGDLFRFTIHPGSYLGDHFELIILLSLPFYLIFKHPFTLLLLQTLILALSAWPVYLIAKNVLGKPWPLFIALIWLLNPFVQNINLFEFHALPFAIFFLLFAFFFYQKNNFKAFLFFCLLSLLVREDVALVVFMFCILSLADKRSWKWVIWPAMISIVWFLIAIKVISYLTPSGSYKFLYYYSWLGSTPGEMLVNFFAWPLNTLKHIFSLNNLLFTVVLFLPFGFVSLARFKYLLLALPVYLQIILGGSSNSVVVLKLHYSSLFLPALFIALIYGLQKMGEWKYRDIGIIILVVASIYGCLTLGPLIGTTKKLLEARQNQQTVELKKEFLDGVNGNDSVAASYEFLTNLSGRKEAYSLNYAFIGKKQFTDLDYRLPDDLDKMLVNFEDLLTYNVQYAESNQWQNNYQEGDDNLRRLIEESAFKVSKATDQLVLFEKDIDSDIVLYELNPDLKGITDKNRADLGGKIEFLGSGPIEPNANGQLIPLSLYFKALQKMDENYQLKLLVKNKDGQTVHEKLYALAYGLYPTSEWQPGETIKVNYRFLMPANLPPDRYQIAFELLNYKGFLGLNGLLSAEMKITSEKILAPAINLADWQSLGK